MNYPLEILPNEKFKRIDCNIESYFLVRLIDSHNLEEIFNDYTQRINIAHLFNPTERIDDLSLSLWGIYNQNHISLKFTNLGKDKYMEECEPDQIVETPQYEKDFRNDGAIYYWTATVGKFHEVTFDYQRSNLPLKAKCFVKHTPMKWNFWHFSLRWTTDQGPLEQMQGNARKNAARKIGHSLRVLISEFARLSKPPDTILPKECYCKN